MTNLAKLIVELAGDLIKFALSNETEQQILERLALRLKETAEAIAALPGIQADRWKEVRDAFAR